MEEPHGSRLQAPDTGSRKSLDCAFCGRPLEPPAREYHPECRRRRKVLKQATQQGRIKNRRYVAAWRIRNPRTVKAQRDATVLAEMCLRVNDRFIGCGHVRVAKAALTSAWRRILADPSGASSPSVVSGGIPQELRESGFPTTFPWCLTCLEEAVARNASRLNLNRSMPIEGFDAFIRACLQLVNRSKRKRFIDLMRRFPPVSESAEGLPGASAPVPIPTMRLFPVLMAIGKILGRDAKLNDEQARELIAAAKAWLATHPNDDPEAFFGGSTALKAWVCATVPGMTTDPLGQPNLRRLFVREPTRASAPRPDETNLPDES